MNMNGYCITFRSVTPAQKGEHLLRKFGYRPMLQRTPRWMEEKGCGYCLRIQTDRLEEVTDLLRKNGVDFRKVYLFQTNGATQEIRV